MNKAAPREVLSATTLIGDKVVNSQDESLGKLEEIMVDLNSGIIAYAVISFGGILGLGEKLFAVPWHLLHVDQKNKCLVVNLNKEQLKNAPGFDKKHWPDMKNPSWHTQIADYYKQL